MSKVNNLSNSDALFVVSSVLNEHVVNRGEKILQDKFVAKFRDPYSSKFTLGAI